LRLLANVNSQEDCFSYVNATTSGEPVVPCTRLARNYYYTTAVF
jgi:hypothetical protein